MKANIDGKLVELKGISLIKMKAQEDEARNSQESKLNDLRDELSKAIYSRA